MALTYDQISSITEKKFIPKLIDNIFDSNPLLQRLRGKSPKINGGERIMVPLMYAQTTANGWFSGNDTLDITDNNQFTSAAYTWKQAYANITVSRLDELKNSGDTAILDLVKNKTMAAEKTLADTLGTGLYNAGTTTKAVIGLRAIIDAASTVGGISQSDYSWWAAMEDTTSTTLTLSVMQNIFSLCTIGNDSPSVIMTNRTLYDLYYNLLQPQQRFADVETAKGGFSSLMFNGIPCIVDSHSPAYHMFFINENYLDLYIHSDENFRFEPFTKPVDQNVKIAKVFFAGALCSSNNRQHGKLEAITS